MEYKTTYFVIPMNDAVTNSSFGLEFDEENYLKRKLQFEKELENKLNELLAYAPSLNYLKNKSSIEINEIIEKIRSIDYNYFNINFTNIYDLHKQTFENNTPLTEFYRLKEIIDVLERNRKNNDILWEIQRFTHFRFMTSSIEDVKSNALEFRSKELFYNVIKAKKELLSDDNNYGSTINQLQKIFPRIQFNTTDFKSLEQDIDKLIIVKQRISYFDEHKEDKVIQSFKNVIDREAWLKPIYEIYDLIKKIELHKRYRYTEEDNKNLTDHLNSMANDGWTLHTLQPIIKGIVQADGTYQCSYGWGHDVTEGFVIVWKR